MPCQQTVAAVSATSAAPHVPSTGRGANPRNARHEAAPVSLRGCLHNLLSSGKIHFLTLRDGTGFIQCVMSKQAVGEEMFKRADHLAQESAIIVEGTARADSRNCR